jgi:hypothetical protein
MVALTMLGQKSVGVDHEKFWTRLIAMIMKMGKPKIMKEAAFNGNSDGRTSSLEKTVHELLDEQRKTRMLLERLINNIEKQGTVERFGKKEYSS